MFSGFAGATITNDNILVPSFEPVSEAWDRIMVHVSVTIHGSDVIRVLWLALMSWFTLVSHVTCHVSVKVRFIINVPLAAWFAFVS